MMQEKMIHSKMEHIVVACRFKIDALNALTNLNLILSMLRTLKDGI